MAGLLALLVVLILFIGIVPDFSLEQGCSQAIGGNLPSTAKANYSGFTVTSSLQALVPSYQFECLGLLTELQAQVAGEDSEFSQIVFQIWRHQGNGKYTVVADLIYPGAGASRDGSTLSITPLTRGIPIRPGDVIGFFLENGGEEQEEEDLLKLLYDSRQDTTVYYLVGTGAPLCNFTTCAESAVQVMQNTAPLISLVFDSEINEEDMNTQENIISNSGVYERCQLANFSSCALKPSTTFLSASQTPLPSPAHDIQDDQMGSSSTEADQTNNMGNNMNDSEMGGTEDKLTLETIIFMAVGSMLLIILIILVVVLIACVCRKRGARLHLVSKAEVESVGGLTSNTRFGASVEHSQQSTTANGSNAVSIATNMDGSIMQSNDYYNLPVVAGDNLGRKPQDNGQQLVRSTSSVAAVNDVQVRGSPRRYTTSSCSGSDSRKVHHYSVLEPPFGLLHSPLPSSSHVPSPVKIGQNGTANGRAPCHSMPAENQDSWSPNYDRLDDQDLGVSGSRSSCSTTPGRPRYDRLSPPSKSPGHYHLDLTQHSLLTFSQELASSGERSIEERKDASLKYHCVPTEEQRRLLRLQHNGHYETSDDIPVVRGYDKLKFFKESEVYWAPASTTTDLYTQLYENQYREIPRAQVNILQPIGSGHFGSVSKGVWTSDEGPQDVAVKTVKTSTEDEKVKLLQEAAIMGQFAHGNVVRVHGVVTMGDPVLVLLEYMPRGDLRSFLHPKNSKRELPDALQQLFIKFSKDIATGMSYLSKKNFVHRDLAARNILLTHELKCKIGDFGMARDIATGSDYYTSHGGIIPVKWTAPEALNYNKYTSASDVWSFGMVLFEIWSMGEKPFSDLTNPIVIALVNSKHCQPPPPGCPRPIYHLMVECWNPKHSQRPTFDSISIYLDSPEESLLQWAQEDYIPGKQAHTIGAPLLEANNLYFDLQRTYQKDARRAPRK